MSVTRRSFVKIAGTAAASELSVQGADALTALATVRRLQSALGAERQTDGRDGFKAGDPTTLITGIAVTAMATMDVLRQASKAGANLIVTHEPTFFCRQDGPLPPGSAGERRRRRGLSAEDPVYQAKQDFIEENELAVFRLHESWLSRKGSEMTAGLAEALGLGAIQVRRRQRSV